MNKSNPFTGGKEKPLYKKIFHYIADNYQHLLVIIGFFLFWELCVRFFNISELVLPSPSNALSHLFFKQANADYHWKINILTTLYELIFAFLITGFFGISIGITLVWSRHVERVVFPAFIFINSLPIIAIAPLILLWMGYGIKTNMLIAFLVSFFPVVINTIAGLNNVEDDLMDLVRYLNASKFQLFRKILIPNALPSIFSGLKICATMSVIGTIVGEFIGSDKGLGHVIINSLYAMDTPPIFSSLILISLLGGGLYLLVTLLERMFMPWAFVKEKV